MEIKQIDVNKIRPNPLQPREHFDRERLKELANSIKQVGLINPITVREKGKGYEIVTGERRWKSHKKKDKILALVKSYKNDGEIAVESLIENIHRENLNDRETGNFLRVIKEKRGFRTDQELANFVGIDNRRVGEFLRLLENPLLLKATEKGKISSSDAKMLILPLSKKEQKKIVEKALDKEDGISTTEIKEEVAKEKLKEAIKEVKQPKPEITVKELKTFLRTLKVAVGGVTSNQNKAVIFLNSLDEKGILWDLEFSKVENELNLAIEATKEYLDFLKQIYRRI